MLLFISLKNNEQYIYVNYRYSSASGLWCLGWFFSSGFRPPESFLFSVASQSDLLLLFSNKSLYSLLTATIYSYFSWLRSSSHSSMCCWSSTAFSHTGHFKLCLYLELKLALTWIILDLNAWSRFTSVFLNRGLRMYACIELTYRVSHINETEFF